MKFTSKQIKDGQDEVILKYRELNPEVSRILRFFHSEEQKLVGFKDREQVILKRHQILYIESVDGKTFAYTKDDVLLLPQTLSQLESILYEINFFRCSKSMILNIDQVESLKSLSSNRIDATMSGGEHILISRTYASDFRKILKGAAHHE